MLKLNNINKIFNIDFLKTINDYFFLCTIKYENNEKYIIFKKYIIKIFREFINLNLNLDF